MIQPLRLAATVLAVAALASPATAQQGTAPPPTVPPSPEDVLGWALGEQFTDVAAVNLYFRTLAQTSDLVSVEAYGRSWEGRPLVQVLVASRPHRERLEVILAANRELTLPDTPEERAREIIGSNPAVVYLSYGVHGNESSSSEAAMWTAWDLARDAEAARGILDSAVVVIDPILNPDGRDRYVDFYHGARGVEPDPDPEAREHREPWPGGRTNHYLFDLNRDWTWLSQIETRARLATWDRWNPQVHVDFHEMSWRSSYFFFPPADPVNPIYPESLYEWARRFGEANAEAFDREGWLYFTGEVYDHFYPGYGDTWPSLLGAVGMTYEQAGGGFAGLVVERPDGTLLTLRDRAQHHRTTGLATLRAAADGRSGLLEDFAAFHRDLASGWPDVLLVAAEGGSRARALADLLVDQGVQVERAGRAFSADARAHPGWQGRERFPAGTWRVRSDQPRGRLALTLLQPETELDATYSYDVSAWSLPYSFGVEAHMADAVPDAGWEPWTTPVEDPDPAGIPASARFGYLVRPDFEALRGVVDFLEAGGRGRVLTDTFRVGGEAFPRGTVFLPRGTNASLDSLVRDSGLAGHVVGVRSGLTPAGRDLGTGTAASLRLPRIALLGGEGTSSGSFGAHWYFLDHRLGLPFDAVNVEDVSGLELDQYDVVVVPAAFGLEDRLGEGTTADLLEWVRAGGTLVASAAGAREVAPLVEVGLREEEADEDEPDEERLERVLRTLEERDLERWELETPGTILPVVLDPGHPVAFGAGIEGDERRMFVLSTGRAFEPADDLETVAHFPGAVEEVSGVISPRTLERLDRGAWAVRKPLGSGSVVLFADDPLYRMMWYSGFTPFANALLLSPAF